MTLVVDASAIVAALVDAGRSGTWADAHIARGSLAAPHLIPVETANILRRAVMAGEVSQDVAALAYADLLDLRVELFPFAPFAERVWELKPGVTAYDAWYVALAEALDAPLVTLDRHCLAYRAPAANSRRRNADTGYGQLHTISGSRVISSGRRVG